MKKRAQSYITAFITAAACGGMIYGRTGSLIGAGVTAVFSAAAGFIIHDKVASPDAPSETNEGSLDNE